MRSDASKRIRDDAAVDAECRAVGGAGGFRADLTDQVGDLFRRGVAPQQRGRPALCEHARGESSTVVPAASARAARRTGAISTQVGPGITELTVTLVPLVVSAAPRAITSWADFKKP
jgi:hypothetical protein